jgi:hypothetical protein
MERTQGNTHHGEIKSNKLEVRWMQGETGMFLSPGYNCSLKYGWRDDWKVEERLSQTLSLQQLVLWSGTFWTPESLPGPHAYNPASEYLEDSIS